MLLILGFVAFIFYKVMAELMFRHGLTVLSAAMMAATAAACAFFAQTGAIPAMTRWTFLQSEKFGTVKGYPFRPLFTPFLIASVFLAAVSLFIVIGFSSSLWKELSGSRHGDLWWFLAVSTMPLAIHYVLTVFMFREVVKNNGMM